MFHRLQHQTSPLKVARAIVTAKLEASIRVRPNADERMAQLLAQVAHAKTIAEVRMLEAQAAVCYWRAWNFSLKTVGRHFPDH